MDYQGIGKQKVIATLVLCYFDWKNSIFQQTFLFYPFFGNASTYFHPMTFDSFEFWLEENLLMPNQAKYFNYEDGKKSLIIF